jgi:hypothetical protein
MTMTARGEEAIATMMIEADEARRTVSEVVEKIERSRKATSFPVNDAPRERFLLQKKPLMECLKRCLILELLERRNEKMRRMEYLKKRTVDLTIESVAQAGPLAEIVTGTEMIIERKSVPLVMNRTDVGEMMVTENVLVTLTVQEKEVGTEMIHTLTEWIDGAELKTSIDAMGGIDETLDPVHHVVHQARSVMGLETMVIMVDLTATVVNHPTSFLEALLHRLGL